MKKFLLSFLVGLTLLFSFVPYISAASETTQSSWYNQDFPSWYIKVYDTETSPESEIFGERYTAAQVQWVVWGLIALPINIFGKEIASYVSCVMKGAGGGAVDLGQCLTGVLEVLTKVVSFVSPIVYENDSSLASVIFDPSTRPVSAIGYVKNIMNKNHLSLDVNAQEGGFGYNHLIYITVLWRVSRDIAFVFAIIATIIFAFMIMFRVKISPQAIITIQSAIPKVIIALVLAAFSFAIAGLVIDLMYVIAGLFATLLASSGFAISARAAYGTLLGQFTVAATPGASFGVGSPITIFAIMIVYAFFFLVSVIWNFLIAFMLGSPVTGTAFGIVGIAITAWLIILSVWYAIKVPWMLFKTVINIYLSIIIAPLQIMAGVFVPGIGFGAWLKNLFANVLVFPMVGLLILLAFNFLIASYVAGGMLILNPVVDGLVKLFGLAQSLSSGGGISGLSDSAGFWSPPWIGQNVMGFVFLMMSFGILVLIPKAAEVLKAIVMGEKFSFGSAIGEAQAPVNALWNSSAARLYRDQMSAQGLYNQLANENSIVSRVLDRIPIIGGSVRRGEIANSIKRRNDLV